MSTATAFKYHEPFPFCVTDLSGTIGSTFDHIGNLSLATVMAFFWNLETFTISMTGTVTDGGGVSGGAASAGINPIAGSPYDEAASSNSVWWYPAQAMAPFASWPAFKTPRDRVCGSYDSFFPGYGAWQHMDWSESAGAGALALDFALSLDPSNAGKYRLYYKFLSNAPEVSGAEPPALSFLNPAANSYAGLVGSGTFTLGGLTFEWEAVDYTGLTTPAGIGMSATSSSYTY